jgi:hypothetical protein
MAFAMVVSLVAPAGSVFAAEAGLALQGTKEVVTSYEIEALEATKDFCFLGAPKDWKTQGWNWASSNEAVATVDQAGLVTTVDYGTTVISVTVGDSYKAEMTLTVKSAAEEMTPVQKTAWKVEVTFTGKHNFNVKGEEGANEATLEVANSVKLYRVFSTDEAAKMDASAFDFMDAEGNGYQAHYIQKVEGKDNVWTITGYNAFKDNAKYAVVYGPNDTSSTLDGIVAFFTAHVGKVAYIKTTATAATVENEIEPAVPAKLTTKLYNAYDIDLTDYYKNAADTEYELADDETDVDATVSGDEVTFDEAGSVWVASSYTYYDEDKEEDVVCTDKVEVFGYPYSTYEITEICAWTLVAEGAKADWSKINHSMIAGDAGQLYVIVKDNRDNYYTNASETTKYNNNTVYVVNDGYDDTAFEQYGYELVFDSLDPDSILVDVDGVVDSYKETKSFAVVSYVDTDAEKLVEKEIGVMGITVTAPRKLHDVKYNNGTSFTILKETEAEDGTKNYWAGYPDFSLSATLKVELLNQYGKTWGSDAEDWGEFEPQFTVTTSKKAFANVAENIADDLNDFGSFAINYYSVFYGTDTTSVTFKIKETATGDSTSVTIKLNEPKYVTVNNVETDEVYVDPSRAILDVAGVELYTGSETTAKLFQVSKANQKIGYFRTGNLEEGDEERSYYVANTLTADFTVKGTAVGGTTVVDFVSNLAVDTVSGSAVSGAAVASGAALASDDYVLVVTDPQGRIFPAVGMGGNNKSFDADSNLGVKVSEDGEWYELVLAAYNKKGELEYATPGNYRVAVYKITSIVTSTGSNPTTKYNVSRVASDSFTVTKDFRNVYFYHQEATKDVEVGSFADVNDVLVAISDTMTFQIAGQKFVVDDAGFATYKDYVTDKKVVCNIEIVDVDFKIQNDGQRAVINTVTFKVSTPAGNWYTSKVKVNRSVNVVTE